MKNKTPRAHQERAVKMLHQSLVSGHKRPMLQAPTGAGKTFIATMLIRAALQRHERVLFIVDAIVLIDQTVAAFYNEGIHDIGVIQGYHPMENWSKPVQVASVQTLRRRGMPAADLVIIDEAHCQHKWLHQQMARPEWKDVPFIGLSATPWSKGLGRIFDDLVVPVTIKELIELQLLSSFRVYASGHPQLQDVTTVGGDYHQQQLSNVMSESGLVADIVETWLRLGENRPTVVFCVDRAHARKMRDRFEAAGVGCGYIDCDTPREERLAIQKKLEAAVIKVVANVGCLTKGVDWALGCIILARPTKSEILFVQMVGRGLRVNPGLEDCLILDHADNTLRLGFVTDIQHENLSVGKKRERPNPKVKEALPQECPSCAYLKPPKTRCCPACGYVAEPPQSKIKEAEGELVEITPRSSAEDFARQQAWFAQLIALGEARGYAPGWAANTFRAKFDVWPNHLDATQRALPTSEVHSFVTSQLIRYARRRAA